MPVDGAAVGFLVALDAILAVGSPLLKEEWHTLLVALTLDVQHPLLFHGPCLVAGLAADNHPVDAGEIEGAEVGEQGFTREELDANVLHPAQDIDAVFGGCILHRCA